MIFFINGIVGHKIIKFVLKKYYSDVKAIVILNSDKKNKQFLKKEYPKKKTIIWSAKNKIHKNLKKLSPKSFFLIWWPFILKKKILNIPKYGTINTHPSFLPHYKGKDPNFWSILKNGPYGVSIHKVNEKIDSGDILFRQKINKINYDVDAKKLYKISQRSLIKLFKDKYRYLRENFNSIKTVKNKKSNIYYRKDMINFSKINLNKKYKAKYIINLLRDKNFPPYSGVLFNDGGKTYNINIKIKKI